MRSNSAIPEGFDPVTRHIVMGRHLNPIAWAYNTPIVYGTPLSAEELSAFDRTRMSVIGLARGADVPAAAAALASSDLLEFAEPNYLRRRMVTPNDPEYANQWAMDNDGTNGLFGSDQGDIVRVGADMNMPAAWDIRTSAGGGSQVSVSVNCHSSHRASNVTILIIIILSYFVGYGQVSLLGSLQRFDGKF